MYTLRFKAVSKFSDYSIADSCTVLQSIESFSFKESNYIVLELGNPASSLNFWVATEIKASLGQDENTSRAQQSTKEGNIRQRILRESPTGDIHKIICKLFLTLSTKVL